MRIQIETIQHAAQRYSTAGDWWWDPDGTLQMRISELPEPRYSALVMMHELTEALLCRDRGITAEEVDAWDMGPGKDLDDPGEDPRAPYHKEHDAATVIERVLAHEMGVNWNAYNDAVDALFDS